VDQPAERRAALAREAARASCGSASATTRVPTLELQFADATSRNLTPPGLRVHELYSVDETRKVAYVLASNDPTEAQLWRVDLAKPWKAKRVAEGRGVESAEFARDGNLRVRMVAPEHGAKHWWVEDAAGQAQRRAAFGGRGTGLRAQRAVADVGPDSLRAFIVRPRDFRPGVRYPVVDWAYAGPHSLRVTRSGRSYLREQWLADQGFIVVTVDGRGTPWRGRTFERAIRGDFHRTRARRSSLRLFANSPRTTPRWIPIGSA
jgi:dipeptidyl-peptidase-4